MSSNNNDINITKNGKEYMVNSHKFDDNLEYYI